MNLRFFGDERDAFKFSLLEKLCTGLGIGLTYVPMLTQDDPEKRNEGNKEVSKDDKRFDPDLIKILGKCFKIKKEALSDKKKLLNEQVVKESSKIIKLISSYFSGKRIDFKCTPKDNGILYGKRDKYFNKINIEDKAQLIFFDPDTGLSEKGNYRHLRFSDLDNFLGKLNKDSIIVVYQHQARGKDWDTMLEEKGKFLPKNKFVKFSDIGFLIFAKNPAKLNEIKSKTGYDLQIYN
jgi:hypothetical protein